MIVTSGRIMKFTLFFPDRTQPLGRDARFYQPPLLIEAQQLLVIEAS
jgi:hypothetical protein